MDKSQVLKTHVHFAQVFGSPQHHTTSQRSTVVRALGQLAAPSDTSLTWKPVPRVAKTVEKLLEKAVRRELTVKAVRFLRGRILSVSCKRTLGLGRSRWTEFAVASVMSAQPSHTRWEGYLYSTVGKGERSCLWALTYRHDERRPYHFSLRPLVTSRSNSACGHIQFICLHNPCRTCKILRCLSFLL